MKAIAISKEIGTVLLSFALLLLSSCGGGGSGEPATYTVGVNVSGLDGSGLVLSDNGADNLAIQANGSSVFAKRVATGAAYNVTVSNQPSNQHCTVSDGTGAITADIMNIAVACIDLYSSTIAPGSGTAQFVEGNAETFAFTVNVSGHNSAGTTPVVTVDSTVLELQGAIDNSIA